MSNFDRFARDIKHTTSLNISLGGIGNALKNAVNPNTWTIGGTPVLSKKGIRDTAEAAAVDFGNYLLPGSSLVTSRLASKGAQAGLSTPLGTASQIGTGLAGVGVGSNYTGIPASPGGAWEAGLFGGGDGGGATGVPASQTADPVLQGDTAAGGAPAWGGSSEAYGTTAPADTAATGAAAKTGMSTAQKIALGLMGVNALTQKPQPLNPDLMAGANSAQTTADNIMAQYNSGQLNPADQYSIAKWAQDSKAKKQQYYAQAGLSDSSMAQQDIAGVDAQAGAMRDQALNNMLQSGLSAAGIANSATGQAVQLQIQQDQAAQQAQQQFFEMLAFSLA